MTGNTKKGGYSMKKFLLALLVFVTVGVLAACGSEEPTYEIALITDHGPVDDRSFNQGAWEGVEAYAQDNDISYTFYRPAEDSGSARLEAIRLAVDAGAQVVVTPGFAFGEPIYEAQSEFPDVTFILLDATPSKDGDSAIADNTLSIFYAEEEAGFLAGYAAVKEGFLNLGYMGGVSVPAVIRFGVGFIEGAEYAAIEDDVQVNFKYTYLGNFDAAPANKTLASSWYNDGTDLIFVAAGGAINNAISAAEELDDKWVIGANVEQQDLSDTILTSSLKLLKESVYNALDEYYEGTFEGGRAITLDAASNGVGITDDFSRFDTFTETQYDAILQKLIDGDITVTSSHTVAIPEDLDLQNTTVVVED
jgi:basic membrane protein A